jgi:hypothetical protein
MGLAFAVVLTHTCTPHALNADMPPDTSSSGLCVVPAPTPTLGG